MDTDRDYWMRALPGAVGLNEPIYTDKNGQILATRNWPDIYENITDCNIDDNVFDVVRSSHVMEHIPSKLIHKAFHEQYRIIKHGGYITVSVPSFDFILDKFINKEESKEWWDNMKNDKGLYMDSELKVPFETVDEAFTAIMYLNGEHLNAFTKVILTKMLERAGFVNIQSADVVELEMPDTTRVDYSLRLMGYKL
jgi:ubiquinone/menaquinone biosynthesis C-methylase UbiE